MCAGWRSQGSAKDIVSILRFSGPEGALIAPTVGLPLIFLLTGHSGIGQYFLMLAELSHGSRGGAGW